MSRTLVAALSLSLLAVLGCSSAQAQPQDDQSYDGTWSVRLLATDGAARNATLVVRDYAGTWQVQPGARRAAKDPCGGRKIPLTVQSSTRTLLAFTVWGETIAPVGEKTLEGTVDLESHASESPEVHASHAGPPAVSGSSSATSAGATGAKRIGSAGSVRLTRR
jgi:hypothetical protein